MEQTNNFYKQLFRLALPITLQNLILSSLNLVDNIIIGGLGETSIAAVGIANQYFFLLDLLLFGIASGSSIFTAQFWGNKDLKSVKRVLGLSLITGIIASSIFTFGGLLFPKQILGFFSPDTVVITLGSGYLRIVACSYVITSITFAFSFALRSTGNVKTPLIISLIALGTNTILNYGLIYGLFGMPRLGINGSALATLIARIIEGSLLIIIIYNKKYPISSTLHELLDLPKNFVKKFYKITVPVILNETTWALGISMYSVIYAHMGTDVIASTNISGTVERLIWVFLIGIGNSCAIMLGNKIGAGKKEEVLSSAKKFMIINPCIALILGIVIYFVSPILLMPYNITPTVRELARNNLIVFSLFICVKAFNYTAVVGIFRSGGDTTFSLLLDLSGVWLIGVPLAFLGAWVLNLPVYYVYALASTEELFKCIIAAFRLKSKKWLNNLTVKD